MPLAGLTAVVQVQHRGDRVHTKRVDMELIQPEAGVGHQEVTDLATSEIEHVRAPIRVLATSRIRILIQRRAVEAAQCERILREVGRNPIHDHTDAGLVQFLNKILEIVGAAQTRIDRVVAGHLITPGSCERMFRQRHELHVREAFLLHVGNQLVGKLTVVVHVLAPAGGVHLIDADRSVMRVAGRAFGHPIGIIPFMGGFDHDGSGARRNLVGALHRIGLHGPFVIGVEDFILVDFAGLNAWDEQFPNAGRTKFAHGVGASVPAIEIADHAHGMRVWRPYGERGANHLLAIYAFRRTHRIVIAEHMCAKCLPQALVTAFAE